MAVIEGRSPAIAEREQDDVHAAPNQRSGPPVHLLRITSFEEIRDEDQDGLLRPGNDQHHVGAG